MILTLLVTSLLLLSAPYVIWPAVVFVLRRTHPTASTPRRALPRVSIVIPAYNEARNMAARLANLEQLDYPKELLEVWLASDGSTDGTADLASAWSGALRPIVVRWPQRRGKAWALAQLTQCASHELVLFTDAGAHLEPGALRSLVDAIEQPGVGAALARYTTRGEAGAGERQYWNFATWLRAAESDADVLHAAHGAAWLARKSALPTLEADTLNDDVALPLGIRAKGLRIAYVPTALVSEPPTSSWLDVFYRLRRIARGNAQLLARHRALLSPRAGRLALALWMQRTMKLLGPLFLLSTFVTALVAGFTDPSLRFVASAIVAGLLTGLASIGLRARGVRRQGPLGVLGYGLVGQAATGLGLIDAILGRNRGVWARPDEQGSFVDLARPAEVPLRVRVAKRAFDLALAVPTLLLLSPFLVVIGMLVKLTSRGPALFVQDRVGMGSNGQPSTFKMMKFRTMSADAEAKSGPVWASREDPRITPLGRILRKARIDELPQLINVVKGEMSLVGPRPERPFFVEKLSATIPGYDDRVSVMKPGISGWAQVHCEYDTSTDSVREKLMFDLTYLAQCYSLRTWAKAEVGMVFRTLAVMVVGKGAH